MADASTAKVRNVNPIGDVVLIDPVTQERHSVAAGDVIEVRADLAADLVLQVGNWDPVPKRSSAQSSTNTEGDS